MKNLQVNTSSKDLESEINRMSKVAKKRYVMAKLYVALWLECLYEIWIQRCIMVFQNVSETPSQAANHVIFRVAIKVDEVAR